MANTTNFNWETPDDTDLVKDGAAAIRTLGNSIDTSFIDLKGGTTGQILSKASNTDLDYTWIANDQGDITEVTVSSPLTGGGSSGSVNVAIQDGTTAQKGAVQLEDSTSSTSTTKAATPNSVKSSYDLANAAIPKSLVDAAGDLIYATADNTVARLGIGTAGQVLKVNSGATAPEWGASSSGAMTLIKRATFSNVASTTTTFDNVFSATYKTYKIVIESFSAATSTDDMQIQLRYAGPTTQASNYYGNIITAKYDSATITNTQQNGTTAFALDINSSGSSQPAYAEINIYGAVSSVRTGISGFGTSTEFASYFAFNGTTTDSRDYLGFLLKSSSTNVSGTVAVYGLA